MSVIPKCFSWFSNKAGAVHVGLLGSSEEGRQVGEEHPQHRLNARPVPDTSSCMGVISYPRGANAQK